ncbi:hypothetical protein HPB52_006031 [Rhipicephalus sanguineus]|uniref:Transmembrane protein n=1 Tax=Rhipicephalus sanguineus TaxID=34632 RepID=A0A9D4PYP9_RHISA|nr:hypothetical protein HPB52_006031 [Rhipicephalus sanguineus]
MLIYRGAMTQHPRGSTSAPAMSPHYWIPPTSFSCTGVTEVQSLLAPFSGGAILQQGAAPPVGQRDDEAFRAERQGDDAAVVAASSEPLDASFPIKRSWSHAPTLFVATLLAFGGLLVVMFFATQLLQPRELGGDEPLVTGVVHQPLVQEPSSGHAYGEDVAAATDDVAVLPAAANRSATVANYDSSPVATASSVPRRLRPSSKKPNVTGSVTSSTVESSVVAETTDWLD